jgi:hypothetical protein
VLVPEAGAVTLPDSVCRDVNLLTRVRVESKQEGVWSVIATEDIRYVPVVWDAEGLCVGESISVRIQHTRRGGWTHAQERRSLLLREPQCPLSFQRGNQIREPWRQALVSQCAFLTLLMNQYMV